MSQNIKDGNSNVQINGDGNLVIHGHPDHMFQLVKGINTSGDIDPAIMATHKHLEELQRRKGMRDARILLLVLVTTVISIAILKWNLYSIPLCIIGAAGIYAGQKQERYIGRINTEMVAGNAILVELYKQKISRQIDAKP